MFAEPINLAKGGAKGTPADLAATMHTNGVSQALIVQPTAEAGRSGWVQRVFSDELAGSRAILVVDGQPSAVTDLAHACESDQIAGIRMLPLSDPAFDWFGDSYTNLYRFAADQQLCVNMLVHPDQLHCAASWIRTHPELTVVIDHLGRPDLAASGLSVDSLLLLADLGQCHVKVSALAHLSRVPYPHEDLSPLIDKVIRAFGTDRLMWGSDYPFTKTPVEYGQSLAVMTRSVSRLIADQRAQILGGTARRLYRLSPS